MEKKDRVQYLNQNAKPQMHSQLYEETKSIFLYIFYLSVYCIPTNNYEIPLTKEGLTLSSQFHRIKWTNCHVISHTQVHLAFNNIDFYTENVVIASLIVQDFGETDDR